MRCFLLEYVPCSWIHVLLGIVSSNVQPLVSKVHTLDGSSGKDRRFFQSLTQRCCKLEKRLMFAGILSIYFPLRCKCVIEEEHSQSRISNASLSIQQSSDKPHERPTFLGGHFKRSEHQESVIWKSCFNL